MSILDFSKVRTSAGNNIAQDFRFKIAPKIDFSTNSTTSSFTDQTQNYYSNQQSSNITNLFAINSNGISADGKINPGMNTSPTTENKTEGGNSGINANVIILGIVAVIALYFGIQVIGDYVDGQSPATIVKEAKA